MFCCNEAKFVCPITKHCSECNIVKTRHDGNECPNKCKGKWIYAPAGDEHSMLNTRFCKKCHEEQMGIKEYNSAHPDSPKEYLNRRSITSSKVQQCNGECTKCKGTTKHDGKPCNACRETGICKFAFRKCGETAPHTPNGLHTGNCRSFQHATFRICTLCHQEDATEFVKRRNVERTLRKVCKAAHAKITYSKTPKKTQTDDELHLTSSTVKPDPDVAEYENNEPKKTECSIM